MQNSARFFYERLRLQTLPFSCLSFLLQAGFKQKNQFGIQGLILEGPSRGP